MQLSDLNMDLNGKVAVVTGASRGLGRSMAIALGKAGAAVVCTARTVDDLESTVAEIRANDGNAMALMTDITDVNDVGRLLKDSLAYRGHVDILVNNAGILMTKAFLEMDVEDWNVMWQTNFMGAVYCARAFGKYMTEQKSGKVINISSSWGLKGIAMHTAYTVTKAALIELTRSLALEWVRYHVTVNCIAPVYFDTAIPAPAMTDPELRQIILRSIPSRRLGQPDELAALVVYLASAASDYMTGETIVIDGGMSIH